MTTPDLHGTNGFAHRPDPAPVAELPDLVLPEPGAVVGGGAPLSADERADQGLDSKAPAETVVDEQTTADTTTDSQTITAADVGSVADIINATGA